MAKKKVSARVKKAGPRKLSPIGKRKGAYPGPRGPSSKGGYPGPHRKLKGLG